MQDVNADLIMVNVFAHWIKKIDVEKFEDNFQILPTNNPTDVNRYSDSILKHMSKDSLKTFENTLLYSKKSCATCEAR